MKSKYLLSVVVVVCLFDRSLHFVSASKMDDFRCVVERVARSRRSASARRSSGGDHQLQRMYIGPVYGDSAVCRAEHCRVPRLWRRARRVQWRRGAGAMQQSAIAMRFQIVSGRRLFQCHALCAASARDDLQLVSSGSTQLNVTVPVDEFTDPEVYDVPTQFRTVFRDGRWQTTAVEQ
jgi:hypothetical protein